MPSTPWLAVLKDGPDSAASLREFLEARGHVVRCFSRGDELVAAVSSENLPAVTLLDVSMAGVDGIAALRSLRKLLPACQVVILSGDGRASTVVAALRLGAANYVVTSADGGAEERLETVIREALEPAQPLDDPAHDDPNDQAAQTWWHSDGPMSQVAQVIERVADCDVIVLIHGESGVGKELVARAIHRGSRRARGPLVKVNCAALPDELLESELFGHERGAFTGAISMRVGKFEQANHGTILLDEIAEMSTGLQAKLLHVLQDGSFTRLGGSRELVVDARVLAATNRNLSEMIADGRFREDLYYRLKVVDVQVPPLRERRQELASLTTYFLRKFSEKYHRPVPPVSAELLQLLLGYSWPGNVRELENCMKRFALLQDPAQVARDLRPSRPTMAEGEGPAAEPPGERTNSEAGSRDTGTACGAREAEQGDVASDARVAASTRVRSLRDVAREAVERAERAAIERTLASVRWNRRRAAERLGVSYKTLLSKIKNLDIDSTVIVVGDPDGRTPEPGAGERSRTAEADYAMA